MPFLPLPDAAWNGTAEPSHQDSAHWQAAARRQTGLRLRHDIATDTTVTIDARYRSSFQA